ncbi:MAG: four helix bundle protein [SAR202 cluster bacterium]|nr:four helix bundle protein [SAR202 cluster bacterium]
MSFASYRDLRVWQGGIELVQYIYALTKTFPNSETYALASQMQRAAVSVPSNIAEGYARSGAKENVRFIAISQGSLAELDTQLEIARRLGYLTADEHQRLQSKLIALSKQL